MMSILFTPYDVHICSSVWEEALGNVVLEAKSFGKPSIIFPSGGLPELVRHGVDGYCCKEKSTEALFEAIQYYLEKPKAIIDHGAAAQQSLDNVFEVQLFPWKWAEVYNGASRR